MELFFFCEHDKKHSFIKSNRKIDKSNRRYNKLSGELIRHVIEPGATDTVGF